MGLHFLSVKWRRPTIPTSEFGLLAQAQRQFLEDYGQPMHLTAELEKGSFKRPQKAKSGTQAPTRNTFHPTKTENLVQVLLVY